MHSIEGALRMSDEINAQFGFERVFGKTNGNADTNTKILSIANNFNILTRRLYLESCKQRFLRHPL